jgi:hypothetical protein
MRDEFMYVKVLPRWLTRVVFHVSRAFVLSTQSLLTLKLFLYKRLVFVTKYTERPL